MSASSRTSTGQSLGCRCPSREGPASSCTSALRVSSGSSPPSPSKSFTGDAWASSGKLMNPLPHEVEGRNPRAPAPLILPLPFDGFDSVATHAVAGAQSHIADHAAQPLRGGETAHHFAHRCLPSPPYAPPPPPRNA